MHSDHSRPFRPYERVLPVFRLTAIAIAAADVTRVALPVVDFLNGSPRP